MVELSERIGLKQYISDSRQGFDTVLAPQGGKLNRAATIKLLLLRAISGKPKLLLLENPFEGLNDEAAMQVADFLLEELKGVTMIVTTNNDYFRQKADLIYRLDKGVIS
jgi:ABC-type transport system involved in cytochrome bd biosynthesis fused ATPase/permease subunit